MRSIIIAIALGVAISASAAVPPAAPPMKLLPPPARAAFQHFFDQAVTGQIPKLQPMPTPASPLTPPRVCSIPLVEVPRGKFLADRMPKVPASSFDHNQVPPPAPPCTADTRIQPRTRPAH